MDMEPVKPANPTAVRFKKGGKLFHPHQFFPAGEQTAFGHEKPFMFDVCIFTVKVCCSLARMEQMLLDMEGFMCVKMKVVAHLNRIGTDMRIGKVRADDRLGFFLQTETPCPSQILAREQNANHPERGFPYRVKSGTALLRSGIFSLLPETRPT